MLFTLLLVAGVGASAARAQTLIGTLEATRQGAEIEARGARAAQRAAGVEAEAGPDEGPNDEAEPGADETPAEAEGPPRAAWDKWDDEHSVKREREGFASWWKLLLAAIGLFAWVMTGDWINRDSHDYELNHAPWTMGVTAAGLIALLLFFVLPFAAAFPAFLLVSFVATIAYGVFHNKQVEPHQRVFTRDWARHEFAELAGKLGVKINTQKAADYEKGAAVDLRARGAGDATKDKANLLTARQSPGYVLVKEMVADMVRRRSDQAMLDYRQDAVSVKHYVDGVWHNGESVERDTGDVTLAVMKQLANLNPAERTKKQSGKIGAGFQGVDYDVAIVSQGVKTGERVMVRLTDPTKKSLKTYGDLGMREKIRDQWGEELAADDGVIVISAQPGAGVTTLTDVSLMETDRLMRDFFSVEDVNKPERDIENIVVHTYDSKKNETPATILQKLIRLYPNVYVCRDLVDAESATQLIAEAQDGKLLVTTVGANEAVEALLRILKKKAPHKEFTEAVNAVINMRLIRTLCDECKVGYEPAPDLLKKLGIPAGKVELLYRVPTQEEQKRPCAKCNGVGYHGRTGLFELLVVNDKVREVLLKKPQIDLLRKAARTAGMRNHQEEGVLLVAKGATSLQELQRVLKG